MGKKTKETEMDAVDEVVTDEPKVDEPKVDEPKVDEPKVDEPKVEEPKATAPGMVRVKAPEGCLSVGGEEEPVMVGKDGTVEVSPETADQLIRFHGFTKA